MLTHGSSTGLRCPVRIPDRRSSNTDVQTGRREVDYIASSFLCAHYFCCFERWCCLWLLSCWMVLVLPSLSLLLLLLLQQQHCIIECAFAI